MSLLRSIEQLAEEIVEGSVRRALRPELQPVELAKLAVRALEESREVGPDGPQIANSFTIYLSPADFRRLAAVQLGLRRQLRDVLERYASDRALTTLGPWQVSLGTDAGLRRGQARVAARFADPPPSATGGSDAEVAQTRRLPARPAVSARTERRSWLELPSGYHHEWVADSLALGRSLDNDVVFEDSRVSRAHARLERRIDGMWVRDLGSTNGTSVNGAPVADAPLHDGDEVSLGGVRLTYRESDG